MADGYSTIALGPPLGLRLGRRAALRAILAIFIVNMQNNALKNVVCEPPLRLVDIRLDVCIDVEPRKARW